jgi:hypothetical protein
MRLSALFTPLVRGNAWISNSHGISLRALTGISSQSAGLENNFKGISPRSGLSSIRLGTRNAKLVLPAIAQPPKKTKMIKKTSFCTILIGAAALAGATAHANTITPIFTAFTPGVSITYSANHSSGHLEAGDGFTIFDIGGFTSVLSVPTNWTSSTSLLGGIFGIAPFPSTPDNPTLTNVTFTYTGAHVHQETGFTIYAPFVIGTTGTTTVIDSWTSRDHVISAANQTNPPTEFVPGAPHTDEIMVPAVAPTTTNVPDGGSTVGLLGLALVGLAVLRRRITS